MRTLTWLLCPKEAVAFDRVAPLFADALAGCVERGWADGRSDGETRFRRRGKGADAGR